MRLPEDVIYYMIRNKYLAMSQSLPFRAVPLSFAISRSLRHFCSPALDRFNEERAHFATLCLVCKLFRDIAQPFLYTSFPLDQSEAGEERMNGYLITLLDRPDLVLHVCNLGIHMVESPDEDSYDGEYSKDYVQQLEMASLKLKGQNLMLEDLSRLEEHVIKYQILLALCTKLESLEMASRSDDYEWLLVSLENSMTMPEDEYKISFIAVPPYPHLLFQSLQRFTFQFLEPELYEEFWKFRSFLSLPSLTHLYLDRFFIWQWRKSIATLPPSNLVEIHLRNVLWRVLGVKDLLIICTNLRVLELICPPFYGSEYMVCELDFPQLGSVLCQYGTRLTNLTVDIRGAFDRDAHEIEEDEYHPLLGSLKPLVCLCSLTVLAEQLLTLPDLNYHFSQDRPIDEYEDNWDLLTDKYEDNWLGLSERLKDKILPDSIEHVQLLNRSYWPNPSGISLHYPYKP